MQKYEFEKIDEEITFEEYSQKLLELVEEKNSEILELTKSLEDSSAKEKYEISQKINILENLKYSLHNKIKSLEIVLKNSIEKYNFIEDIKNILDEKGLDEALSFIEEFSIESLEDKAELSKFYLVLAMIYNIKTDYEKSNEYFIKSLENQRDYDNSIAYINYLVKESENTKAIDELEFILENLELEKLQKAFVLNKTALLYKSLEKLEAAEDFYLKSLELYISLENSESKKIKSNIAMIFNNLAIIYNKTKNFKESTKAYEKTLSYYKELLNLDSYLYRDDLSSALNNYALFLKEQNKDDEALKFYKEALEIRKELALEDAKKYNPYLSMTLNNMAILYKKKEDFVQAEEFYKKTLEIREELINDNFSLYRPYVAMSLNNLAILYKTQNRLEDAEKYYKKTLKIYKELSIPNPMDYKEDEAQILNNLAILYKLQNRLDDMEKSYLDALEIRRKLAQENPGAHIYEVSNILSSLAVLYAESKKEDKANKFYDETLKIRKELSSMKPEEYSVVYAKTLIIGVAALSQDVQNLEEALEILNKYTHKKEALVLIKMIKSMKAK